MSTESNARITPEQYLAIERTTTAKSKYLNGEVFSMGGASFAHVQIVTNLVGELRSRLKGRPCRVLPTDLRLQITPTGLYTYPDVVVACEPFAFADEHRDTLTNPVVIIEVLSDSIQDYDRDGKFTHYRSLDSLREYLLIDQARVHAEHFVRQHDRRWLLAETNDPAAVLTLESIGVELPLADVYEGVLPA